MNVPILQQMLRFHTDAALQAGADFRNPSIANNAEKKGDLNLAATFHTSAVEELTALITAAKASTT